MSAYDDLTREWLTPVVSGKRRHARFRFIQTFSYNRDTVNGYGWGTHHIIRLTELGEQCYACGRKVQQNGRCKVHPDDVAAAPVFISNEAYTLDDAAREALAYVLEVPV